MATDAERNANLSHWKKEDEKKGLQLDQPQSGFRLSRDIYKKYLEQSKGGDVVYLQYQGKEYHDGFDDNKRPLSNLVLLGSDSQSLPPSSVYKSLSVIKPDLVLVSLPAQIQRF